MQKSEFEALIKGTVTDSEYSIIETVYTYHPVISDVQGKKQITGIYLNLGMNVIVDMYPRAKKVQEIECALRELKAQENKINDIRNEVYNALSLKYLEGIQLPSVKRDVIQQAIAIVDDMYNNGSHDAGQEYIENYLCEEMASKIIIKLENLGVA